MYSSARLLNEDAKLNITNAWTVSEFGVANITWCQQAWWLNYYRHQDKENEGAKCRFKFQSQSDKFVAKTFTRHFCLWWITGWAFGQTGQTGDWGKVKYHSLLDICSIIQIRKFQKADSALDVVFSPKHRVNTVAVKWLYNKWDSNWSELYLFAARMVLMQSQIVYKYSDSLKV